MVKIRQVNNVIQYQVYPDLNFFKACASGELTFEHIFQHVEEIINDPDYQTGMNGFYDFHRITRLTGNVEQFQAVAEDMSDHNIIDKQGCTSVVLPDDNDSMHNMMQGFILMASDSLIDYQVFHYRQWQQALLHVGLNQLPD